MRDVFSRSNIYPCFKTGYGDLGLFGQSAGILVENDETTVRMMQLVHGRFWIARDENGRVNTLYRKFRWAVDRIIGRFGYNKVSPPILTNTLTAGDFYQNVGSGTIALTGVSFTANQTAQAYLGLIPVVGANGEYGEIDDAFSLVKTN